MNVKRLTLDRRAGRELWKAYETQADFRCPQTHKVAF